MTRHCARLFFEQRFAPQGIDIAEYGNVAGGDCPASRVAVEEMDRADLDVRDPLYPVITGIRARKSAA